jgi:hypothetical protein
VEKAIKEMWDKKATGDDDDVSGLKIMTQLINDIYETGEWPKDLNEVTMIALNKEPKATKFGDYHIISLIAHTAKIVARILRRRIETTIEDVLGLENLGFRTAEGTRYATGMLKLISE